MAYLQQQYNRVQDLEELSTQEVSSWDLKCQAFRYITISGFVGASATTLAKSCSGLLTLCFQGENQFATTFTYIILIGWIHFMQVWLSRMDAALKMFDTFAVPLLELVWTLFSIIAGGLYFKGRTTVPLFLYNYSPPLPLSLLLLLLVSSVRLHCELSLSLSLFLSIYILGV